MKLQEISTVQSLLENCNEMLLNMKESAIINPTKIADESAEKIFNQSVSNMVLRIREINNKHIDKPKLLEQIKSIVFEISGIPFEQLSIKTRKREIVMDRQLIMAVYHKAVNNVSLAEAGYIFKLDHATVLHACKTLNNLRETDKNFESDYKKLWDWALQINPDFTLKVNKRR